MIIQNSIQIHNCYKYGYKYYYSLDKRAYRREYYLRNKKRILRKQKEWNDAHKERQKRLKAIWFQKNKERLRIKWGYITRYETKNKPIDTPTKYEIRSGVINFD